MVLNKLRWHSWIPVRYLLHGFAMESHLYWVLVVVVVVQVRDVHRWDLDGRPNSVPTASVRMALDSTSTCNRGTDVSKTLTDRHWQMTGFLWGHILTVASWLACTDANLLFLDSPTGVGYSYSDDPAENLTGGDTQTGIQRALHFVNYVDDKRGAKVV